MEFLCDEGPKYGYFPTTVQSIYVCKAEDELKAREAFEQHVLKVPCSHGENFLGCCIEYERKKAAWLKEKALV